MSFFYVKQFPVPAPQGFSQPCPWSSGRSTEQWLSARVAFLSCTSWSMTPMAEELTGQPQVFPWNPEKRVLIRAEIDAAMFHIYGVTRDDVDYIMETFRIVKENDEAAYGEYRTKRIILSIYDAMQHAIDSGSEYRSEAEQFLEEGRPQ